MNQEQAKIKQELNRLRRQKSVLWLGILFFVAVLAWTTFAIFSSQKKVKVDVTLTELAKPLVPRLAAEVFKEIEARRDFSDEELSSFPIYVYYESGERGVGVLTNIIDLPELIDSSEASIEADLFPMDIDPMINGDLIDETSNNFNNIASPTAEVETDFEQN